MHFSRRRFLQVSAASAASVASMASWPGRSLAAIRDEFFEGFGPAIPGGAVGDPERVIVIGSGFAGLGAANALCHAGVDVVVLEARDRIGGRTFTEDVGGVPVDMGASWIHNPIGNPMTRLADNLGVGHFLADPIPDLGSFTAYDAQTGQHLDPLTTFDAFLRSTQFDQAIGAAALALGPRATIADAIPFFLNNAGLTGDDARLTEFVIRLVHEQNESGAASDIGLNSWLDTDIESFGGSDFGDFPVGGYREIVNAIAAGLDIRTGREVREIEVKANGVRVRVRRREGGRVREQTLRGSHVLVTVPLGSLKRFRMRFEPVLPLRKRRAIQRLGSGFFEKIALHFPEPFWQADGGTHFVYAGLEPSQDFRLFLDFQRFLGEPVLVGLTSGAFARSTSRMSRREIKQRVLATLREAYGSVPEPDDVEISRWGRDPYSAGAYSFYPVGGESDDRDALAEPVLGRLLFAGEATTKERNGYADGAFSSGVREAKRLLGVSSVRVAPLDGQSAGLAGTEAALFALARFRERGGRGALDQPPG